jgi:hypothetical protein
MYPILLNTKHTDTFQFHIIQILVGSIFNVMTTTFYEINYMKQSPFLKS